MEPQLQILEDNKQFKGVQQAELSKKIVAHADRISVIAADTADSEDVAEAIQTVNQICERTQFQLNEGITKIFYPFEKRSEQRLKLLGMYLHKDERSEKECYKQMFEKEVQKMSQICRTTKSMKFKGDILKTLVMPSIVFLAKLPAVIDEHGNHYRKNCSTPYTTNEANNCLNGYCLQIRVREV